MKSDDTRLFFLGAGTFSLVDLSPLLDETVISAASLFFAKLVVSGVVSNLINHGYKYMSQKFFGGKPDGKQ